LRQYDDFVPAAAARHDDATRHELTRIEPDSELRVRGAAIPWRVIRDKALLPEVARRTGHCGHRGLGALSFYRRYVAHERIMKNEQTFRSLESVS
jgi:hypothetical protein